MSDVANCPTFVQFPYILKAHLSHHFSVSVILSLKPRSINNKHFIDTKGFSKSIPLKLHSLDPFNKIATQNVLSSKSYTVYFAKVPVLNPL